MNDRDMAEEINNLVKNGMSPKEAAEQVMAQRPQPGIKKNHNRRFDKVTDEAST